MGAALYQFGGVLMVYSFICAVRGTLQAVKQYSQA